MFIWKFHRGGLHDCNLPVWNALYQVRDFAQYVNWVARDRRGRAVAVHMLDKSSWHISGAKDGAIVEYEILADYPGPFGAQVNAHHGFLNLAEILMYPSMTGAQGPVGLIGCSRGWNFATPLMLDAGISKQRIMIAWWTRRWRLAISRSPTSMKAAGTSGYR